ncbi:MAG TPA: hypothetical protein VMI75_37000 [Polyangiaceae bacterium]|nr:hypothetical protein [Polyangiaceae bacterium]
MRLPTKLAFTAFHIAVAGTLACSAKTDGGTDHAADAAPDVPMEAASDAAGDAVDDVTVDVADSATNDVATRDAVAMDASVVDAPTDVFTERGDECGEYFCGSVTADADCPGAICDLSECPLDAGCEPFV